MDAIGERSTHATNLPERTYEAFIRFCESRHEVTPDPRNRVLRMPENSLLTEDREDSRLPRDKLSNVGEPEIRNRRTPGSALWEGDHPINLRLSIPLLFKRYYVTIVAGEERRSPERRLAERQKHPIKTTGNVIALFISGIIVGLAALGALQLLTVHLFGGQ